MSVASQLGLSVQRAIIMQNANRLVVRLVPCDVLARIVIDHLDAIACTVRNEHAARSGVERGVVKRLDDDPLSGSLRVPVSSH